MCRADEIVALCSCGSTRSHIRACITDIGLHMKCCVPKDIGDNPKRVYHLDRELGLVAKV